jgi:hypothetical protein
LTRGEIELQRLFVVLLTQKRSRGGAAMGEEKQRRGHAGKNKYAVACSIMGSIISILMGYGN